MVPKHRTQTLQIDKVYLMASLPYVIYDITSNTILSGADPESIGRCYLQILAMVIQIPATFQATKIAWRHGLMRWIVPSGKSFEQHWI